MCRGCCCGTAEKHPTVDHGGQLDRLRRAASAASSTRLWTADCLGPCERSNVVVVRSGSTRRWFGAMLTDGDTEALAEWIESGATAPLPTALSARAFHPDASAAILARRLPLDAEAITDLVERTLTDDEGGWTLGVEGAAAELSALGGRSELHRSGRMVESASDQGGLRLEITDGAAAFAVEAPATGVAVAVILAVPRSSLTHPATTLTPRGPDAAALRPGDTGALLFDLGIGHPAAAFCVRPAEHDLASLLDGAAGTPWPELLDALGPEIARRSPPRVVTTALGRAEVYAPIPATDGASPPGPHTHLHPGLLALGRELPDIFTLPSAWAPAAVFYPPAGWAGLATPR